MYILAYLPLVTTAMLIRRADKARDRKQWSLAREIYTAILRRKPVLASVWVQLGHVLREKGCLTEALAAYREADRLRPHVGDTIQQIARVQEALGEYGTALRSYGEALTLDGQLHSARREIERVKLKLYESKEAEAGKARHRFRFVNLGTTGTCNASCIHCPTGKAETAHVPRSVMPMELFKKIIDGIASSDYPVTDQIAFGLFGDALVDPMVVQRAEYLRSRLPSVRLSINTNGAAFNWARHKALAELATLIVVHCESITPEVYNDIMRPLRHERVFPKLETMLDKYRGKITVSVPLSKKNIAEAPAIKAWFLSRGANEVVFDPLSSRCAEDRSVFDSLAFNPKPIRCGPDVIDDLIIDCDGKVLMCCQDFQRLDGLGELATSSFTEMLEDIRRINARRTLAEGRHVELATCSRCFGDTRGGIAELVPN